MTCLFPRSAARPAQPAVATATALAQDRPVPLPRILAAAAAALSGGLAAPSIAAACTLDGPVLRTHLSVPLDCPVYVYAQEPGLMPFEPRLTVLRGGSYVDVTGAVARLPLTLPVQMLFEDCQQGGIVSMHTQDVPFARYAIKAANVQVGDRIGVGMGWFAGLEVTPAAPCPAPEVPMLACSEGPPCGGFPPFSDSFDSGPCASGGGPGALAPVAGLAALLVVRRRRRPRPRG